MAKSYLILGSNSADKRSKLESTVLLLSTSIGKVLQGSSLYESEPWGYKSTNSYLNQVLLIETPLNAEELLAATQSIERKLGRKKKSVNGIYEDRPIDIDILFYNKDIVELEHLQIPHPRIPERRFVLKPLYEIAPHLKHPTLNKTVENLLRECTDNSLISKL